MTLNKSRIVAASLTALGCVAARPAAAQFITQNFTGDADSGISSTKTYTAAVDFNGHGNPSSTTTPPSPLIINGVSFYSHVGGSQTDTIRNETVSIVIPNNTGSAFNNNPNNNLTPGTTNGGVKNLCSDFFFDTSGGTQTETVSFNGLTTGTTYKATFYNVGFGTPGTRVINVSDGLGHTLNNYDENQAGNGNGNLLMDTYTATSNSVTFSFATTVGGNSFHQYGFTNELVASAATPEPSAVAGMLAGGFMLLGAWRRRRK